MFHFSGESRVWAERRGGVIFGRERNIETALLRQRLSLDVRPARWLKLSAMMQDTRAPHYQRPRPGTAQDPVDLHEGYVEFNPDAKTGWGLVVGRKRLSLGDQHVIGVPEWVNSGRTYDLAQFDYRSPSMRLRWMLVSQVKFQPAGFNKPVLGDRLYGFYYELPKAIDGGALDVYVLRHDQNAPGGFVGPGRLASTSLGTRTQVPLSAKWRVTLEPIAQFGERGLGRQRAFGSIVNLARKVDWQNATASVEYKFASPDFDQMYPAHHDRLGHADMIFMRNIHSVQPKFRWLWGKHSRLTAMYTANWLMDTSKPLYGFTGASLGLGRGSFIGQEFAMFTVHNLGHWTFGLGYAYWKNGEAVKSRLPGNDPTYAYIHTAFSF